MENSGGLVGRAEQRGVRGEWRRKQVVEACPDASFFLFFVCKKVEELFRGVEAENEEKASSGITTLEGLVTFFFLGVFFLCRGSGKLPKNAHIFWHGLFVCFVFFSYFFLMQNFTSGVSRRRSRRVSVETVAMRVWRAQRDTASESLSLLFLSFF